MDGKQEKWRKKTAERGVGVEFILRRGLVLVDGGRLHDVCFHGDGLSVSHT